MWVSLLFSRAELTGQPPCCLFEHSGKIIVVLHTYLPACFHQWGSAPNQRGCPCASKLIEISRNGAARMAAKDPAKIWHRNPHFRSNFREAGFFWKSISCRQISKGFLHMPQGVFFIWPCASKAFRLWRHTQQPYQNLKHSGLDCQFCTQFLLFPFLRHLGK